MKKIFTFFAALACVMSMSAVTYNVTVPAGTKACYIAGEMNGWSQVEMNKVDDTHYTLDIADATEAMPYKYCSGPGWAYVEKTADGGEVADRAYTPNDVVAFKYSKKRSSLSGLAEEETNPLSSMITILFSAKNGKVSQASAIFCPSASDGNTVRFTSFKSSGTTTSTKRFKALLSTKLSSPVKKYTGDNWPVFNVLKKSVWFIISPEN